MLTLSKVESVQQYYGKILASTQDLQTSACCTAEAMPAHLRPLLADIHDEVQAKFYGCGSPIPSELEGCTVLDLGSGSGRDCYLLSRLVGEHGRVIGVDITVEQLAVARRHVDWQIARSAIESRTSSSGMATSRISKAPASRAARSTSWCRTASSTCRPTRAVYSP